MFRFEKLDAWKMAIDYANSIYDICETLPKSEIFGLASQLRRAALSISSNIAEGSGSSSTKDLCSFLDIAIKSTIETVSQLHFALQRKYLTEKTLNELYAEAEVLVKRIQALKSYLKKQRAITYNPRAVMEEPHD
ncbi:MAG: four helix bundle protein [Candidatus Curtissbacteria bacterium]